MAVGQPLSGALKPVVGLSGTTPQLVADLIGEAQALVRDRGRHRGAGGNLIDQPPQTVTGQEPLDEVVKQTAVEEAVDQSLGALALKDLLEVVPGLVEL